MEKFSTILKKRRESLGLSRRELANKIKKSQSYILALEDPNSERKPSLETLRRIVFFLSCNKEQFQSLSVDNINPVNWRKIDSKVPFRLILSAIGIEPEVLSGLPFSRKDGELKEQTKLEEGAEVWVVSDLLYEAMSKEYAEYTANNIKKRGIKYIYFLPTYVHESHWKRAIEYIKAGISESAEMVHESVRLYYVARCAFGCRLRISNPRGQSPTASYSLSSGPAREYLHYPVPSELITTMVRTFDELIHIEEQKSDSDWAYSVELGAIRLIFPEKKAE